MESLTQALRRLWLPRNRGYALTAVFTLALSVAALCAVGMLFYALILAPLPYNEPERVVFLNERNEAKGIDQFSVSAPNFRSWQVGARSFSELAAFVRMDANLGGDGAQSAERAIAYRASWNLWRTLGLRPLLGNTFDARAEQERAAVVVLSESLWRRRYGADPTIIGRAVLIDNAPHVVLGVVPTDHGFINEGALWLPLPDEEYIHNRDDRRWDVVGRLAPGVTPATAASELEALSSALAREFHDSNQGWQARLHDARAWILGPNAATRIAVTLAAVLLLLLVACTNIANLQVARASARLGEYSVRHALGASRWRMLRDALGESSLLAILGASLGVVLASQLLPMALAWLPAATPRMSTVRFEPGIAWITVLTSVLVAMLFGLAPAMLAARGAPGAMLVRAGRGALSGTSARLRHALVMVQFALATALTVSAIMLAQQFLALARADTGFARQNIVTAHLALPPLREPEQLTEQLGLLARLADAARALPGVEAVGWTSQIPMGSVDTSMEIWGASASYQPGDPGMQVSWRIASAGYLDSLRVPVLSGRDFRADERDDVALLSAQLAARLWPDQTAVGRQVVLSNGRRFTVVGVVGDVRQLELGKPQTPTVYLPTSWYLWPTMVLTVRTQADPGPVLSALREAALRVAPQHPLFDIRTLDHVVAVTVAEPRLQTSLFVLFAAASALLAALGVAGVTAFMVAQRTPELAMRMALGASAQGIRWHVLRGNGAWCVLGVLLGLVPAWLGVRALRGLIVGSTMNEFGAAAMAVLALLAVGAVTCWWSARRVLHIEPSQALRAL